MWLRPPVLLLRMRVTGATTAYSFEVSADPRDGTDFVQTNPTHATSLELVALNDNVRLRRQTVHFWTAARSRIRCRRIRPGEHVRVDLPELRFDPMVDLTTAGRSSTARPLVFRSFRRSSSATSNRGTRTSAGLPTAGLSAARLPAAGLPVAARACDDVHGSAARDAVGLDPGLFSLLSVNHPE